jgi:outer membrane protein assembly factor BamB
MRRTILLLATCCLLWACGTAQRAVDPGISPGEILWQHPIGAELWAPLELEDGTLYFGDDSGTFHALDTATRETRWRFAAAGRIRSAAAIVDDTVLFASDDGFLYALGVEGGDERWRFDLGSAELERRLPATTPPFDYDYLHSSPTTRDGVVYIGSADGNLYAVDLETGAELWRFTTADRIRSTPAVAGDTVYVGSWDGRLYAVDAATGEQVWSFDTGGRIQSSPAVAAGRIIVGSRAAKLFALNAETGEPEWTYPHEDGSWVESSPVVRGDVVYIGSSDALKLFALDAGSGEEQWQFETGGWSWSTPLVTADTVFIGSISAYPYYFEGVDLEAGFQAVDRQTGDELWRMTPAAIDGYVTGGVFSTPRAWAGVVYVAALDGVIYAIGESRP